LSLHDGVVVALLNPHHFCKGFIWAESQRQ